MQKSSTFPKNAPLRVVRFVLEEYIDYSEPFRLEVIKPEGDLREVLNRIGKRLNVPLAKSLIGQRELRVHGHNEVVIIKPARPAALDGRVRAGGRGIRLLSIAYPAPPNEVAV